jgi:hypothetical protein
MMKPAIFMAIILWSHMGLVNITLANDSQNPELTETESVDESSYPTTVREPIDSTDELPSYDSTTGETQAVTDSVEKSPPFAMITKIPFLSEFILAPRFGKDHFGATVGYKAWFNTWDLPISFRGNNSEDQMFVANVRSQTEISHIPIVSFRYKNFFVSGSYFPKTDYHFSKMEIDEDVGDDGIVYLNYPKLPGIENVLITIYDPSDHQTSVRAKMPIEYSISAERSEWELTTGYYISQNIAVTVGYKNIKRHYSQQYYVPPIPIIVQIPDVGNRLAEAGNRSTKIEYDSKGNGLTLGLIGAVSLGRGFGLYGSFAYGWLDSDETYSAIVEVNGESRNLPKLPSISHDNNYYLGEMGLIYSLRFRNPAINAASFYLGYRFQRYDFENATASGQTARDSSDGFVLGVNLIF